MKSDLQHLERFCEGRACCLVHVTVTHLATFLSQVTKNPFYQLWAE